MTTGKTIALTRWIFVGKVMLLLFNILSRIVIAFFLRNFSSSVATAQFSSVQCSRSVVSDSLWPHGLQHIRPPCPSPSLGVYSNSCPLSPWCHPTISSAVIPFSSHYQSFPAWGSFQMSKLFASSGQNIGVSVSASVFSNESTLRMRWPKYWSFSFSIIPSKEYPGLISFRMDW